MSTPGHIYLVELPGGYVKVGRSVHRFDRLAHYTTAGAELLCWISPRFDGYRGAETAIIATLAARWPRGEGSSGSACPSGRPSSWPASSSAAA